MVWLILKQQAKGCYLWCLGGGFKYFLFSPLFGKMIHFDEYFSTGLKPPTRMWMSLSSCRVRPSGLCKDWLSEWSSAEISGSLLRWNVESIPAREPSHIPPKGKAGKPLAQKWFLMGYDMFSLVPCRAIVLNPFFPIAQLMRDLYSAVAEWDFKFMTFLNTTTTQMKRTNLEFIPRFRSIWYWITFPKCPPKNPPPIFFNTKKRNRQKQKPWQNNSHQHQHRGVTSAIYHIPSVSDPDPVSWILSERKVGSVSWMPPSIIDW